MNYIRQIAEMMNVEWDKEDNISETFTIKINGDSRTYTAWFIDSPGNIGFAVRNENFVLSEESCINVLYQLLTGKLKKVFAPQINQLCWAVLATDEEPFRLNYDDSVVHKLLLKRGLLFENKEEAEEKMVELGWY